MPSVASLKAKGTNHNVNERDTPGGGVAKISGAVDLSLRLGTILIVCYVYFLTTILFSVERFSFFVRLLGCC